MSDDFISMKILIVSEAAPERELLRRVSAEASIPVDAAELDAPGDPVAMSELLARQNFDVVFFDSRMPSRRGRNCSTPSVPRPAARWRF